MRLIRPITAFAAVAACSAVAATSASAAPAQGTARQFEGTVVSVNVENRTFRLRDTERGTVRIRVTASTRFERLSGLRALRAGMRNIESRVRRSGGDWVAIEVERSGGGGSHGGDDSGGSGGSGGDDSGGRGRGSDDPAGDDSGGGGRGRGRGGDEG
jgi:hypothetical protein